jgi:calcium permeable stress-gated cation channel
LQALEKRRRSSASRSDAINEKSESNDRSASHGRTWKNKLKGHTEDDERPFAAGSPISPTQASRPGTGATQDGSRFHHLNPVAPIMNLIKGEKNETVYPPAYDPQYENDDYGEPVWKKYLTDKDRPTHRLPLLSFLPSLPLIGQKVDTIHYCRKEVARLNVEIEQDQQEPEKFPLMNSAFIQFNNQVAAHMACQSVNHHIPQQMAPRYLEVNPNDVLWENMRIKWWERYLRSMLVSAMVAGLIIGWAFPVGFVGLISQVDYLQKITWLSWIEKIPNELLSVISGVLPPLGLAILMALLPVILRTFARIQGLHTGMSVELAVQGMYFAFLFVQVFLVVSISSGITATIKELRDNPASAAQVLATNLPKASNFFFSYLLIQAFAQSGGALLQIGTLAVYYLLSPFFDVTARQKWARQTNLTEMKWGTFFPVYTNLACIGLVYSVISPLILIFNMFTFGLFWVVYRYNLLFVNNFKYDTGGLLFPRAINQLFTGIYVMELCLIGLFFLVRDAENRVACSAQGGIMIAVLALTVLYQRALNKAFGPVITYLPITLEDEAAARDKLFAKEHDAHRRLTVVEDADDDGDVNAALAQREAAEREADAHAEEIELEEINRRKSGGLSPPKKRFSFKPQKKEKKDHWSATNPADTLKKLFPFTPSGPQSQEEKDLEAAEVADRRKKNQAEFALFDDIPDEIEDLSPEERDKLVSRAFQHSALRAKRPVIWIPRDDLGIADDEIWRTQRFSKHIWVSNEYTGLDAKARVTYKRSPPDFDARDLVDL